MILQFITQLVPGQRLSADITPDEYTNVLKTGMFGGIRVAQILLTVHEDQDEDHYDREVWYSFEAAKTGVNPFLLHIVEGDN